MKKINIIADKNRKSLAIKNLHYRTNVKGKMTAWDAFCKNEKFLQLLHRGFQDIIKFATIPKINLDSAWGLKIEKDDYTSRHNHDTATLSGILYLNDVDQELIFPDHSIKKCSPWYIYLSIIVFLFQTICYF